MTDESIFARLQSIVRQSGLDGWLLYDFRGLNPFPAQVLQLGHNMLTRRWFLYVSASGQATIIHHVIEAGNWLHLLPDTGLARKVFSTHQELDEALRQMLAGAKRIAMEYSPRGAVPYVGFVDAGTLERVRECGVEVVSSADLLQNFMLWNEEDRLAHLEAVQGVIRAKDAGFRLVDARLKAGQPVTELEMQAEVVKYLAEAGLEFDHPPIAAFGSHASDGHYSPNAGSNRTLEMGMCVLLDLWGGYRDRPMVDITWVGFAGEPTPEYLHAWEAVRDGRDAALNLLQTRTGLQGWEVDRAAREVIAGRGYGGDFRHRLGHSLGHNAPHGPSANLDDYETHDTRRLLPGLAVTVEPGVYLEKLGVRSEVNVLITAGGATVTTPVQSEPYRLGI